MKKQQQQGFAQLLIVLVAIVATAVGGTGFTLYRHNQRTAHASGLTRLGNINGITVYACRTYLPVYGGVNRVKATFIKSPSMPNLQVSLVTLRKGQTAPIQQSSTSTYLSSVMAELVTNVSVIAGDRFGVATGGLWGSSSKTVLQIGPMSASNLSVC